MGWAGGNDIFDAVAHDVMAAPIARAVRMRILSTLIGALQDQDWDTEDEALGRWSMHREAVDAFRLQGIHQVTEGDSDIQKEKSDL